MGGEGEYGWGVASGGGGGGGRVLKFFILPIGSTVFVPTSNKSHQKSTRALEMLNMTGRWMVLLVLLGLVLENSLVLTRSRQARQASQEEEEELDEGKSQPFACNMLS